MDTNTVLTAIVLTPPGNVTLGQGHSAPVEETVIQEGAGASVTLTVRGTKLA